MALGAVPYKYRVTGALRRGSDTDFTIIFDILDANNSVLAPDVEILVSDRYHLGEILESLRSRVYRQMEIDAGSKAALFQGIRNRIIQIDQ